MRPPRHQGFAQNLIDRLDHHELHLLAQIGGDIVEVGLVVRRHQDASQPGAVRAEHLLLDPTDWQDLAAQRDLARHRHIVADRTAGEDGGHRGQHGDAG